MDAIAQRRAAEFMVMRMLVSDLFVEMCLRADDPNGEAQRRARLNLDALDSAAETSSIADDFKHAALHEMERFWAGVRHEVATLSAVR